MIHRHIDIIRHDALDRRNQIVNGLFDFGLVFFRKARQHVVDHRPARQRTPDADAHARKMLIAVCVLAVVFTGLCVTATVMYDKYNPDEFIASVDAALEAGDARALKNLLKVEDLTVSDEGAAALCRAFTDAAQREALRGQRVP